jgi:hypothetical protein
MAILIMVQLSNAVGAATSSMTSRNLSRECLCCFWDALVEMDVPAPASAASGHTDLDLKADAWLVVFEGFT